MKWDLAAFIAALAVGAAGLFVVLAECVREFGIADVVAVLGITSITCYIVHEIMEKADD
jgi:uncharacterized membrane protein YeiB